MQERREPTTAGGPEEPEGAPIGLARVSRDPIWVMQHGTDADPDEDRREGV